MILVFTGNGKGKTTAALGQAVRSMGEGKKVLMVQFIKGPWKSGEDYFCSKFSARGGSASGGKIPNSKFQILKTGKGFVGILGDELPREEHMKAAEDGLSLARKEVESGQWDVLILDEINNAVHLGLIPKEKVLEFLEEQVGKLEHLILTGRDAPLEFIERADLVTEMREVKHPFGKGIRAKRGLEY